MRPTQIVYPEDKLIRAYYNRDPTAKFVPADLSSAHTHHVRAFARRQLKVMQTRRLPEDEALKIVEAEAAAEERRAKEAEALRERERASGRGHARGKRTHASVEVYVHQCCEIRHEVAEAAAAFGAAIIVARQHKFQRNGSSRAREHEHSQHRHAERQQAGRT